MGTKIGFIGIVELLPVLENVKKEFEKLMINYYFYDHELQAVNLTKKAEIENDVLLFGGPVPHKMVTEQYTLRKPSSFITYDGAALYRGLLEVIALNKQIQNRISIDTVTASAVEQIYHYLNLSDPFYLYKESHHPHSSDLVRFHQQKYEQNITNCAVTCLRSTYQTLQHMSIPSVLVLAPESAVREGIQKSILMHQSETFKKSQIVVGLINIHVLEEFRHDYPTLQKNLEIHHLLVTYAQALHAAVYQTNQWQFVFYTTRGMLETQSLADFETFLTKLKKIVNATIQIGLGIGISAQTANNRASIALTYSNRQLHQDNCFMTTNNSKIVNLLQRSKLQNTYRIVDVDFTLLAQRYNISPIVLSNYFSVMDKLGKSTFTAEELATELSQTPRNVRRTLHHFVEKSLAIVVGEEHLSGKGRPKLVYELTFTNHLKEVIKHD